MLYFVFALCAIAVVCLVIILRDTHRFVTVTYEIKSSKIKEKATFVMLSDLHNQTYGPGNEKLIAAVERIHPDAVLVVGDMYTSEPGSGYENADALLSGLSKHFPIYYANGNHESKTKRNPKTFRNRYEKYKETMERQGVTFLVNSRVTLPEKNISICGLELGKGYFKHFSKKEMPEGYVEELTGKAEKDRFQILLAHHPDYFMEYAKWGADLTLAGHIHGGVVRLPYLGGVVSPAISLFPKYDGGLFWEKDKAMILGRGLGTHTIPVRMWNPGELVEVRLCPKEKTGEAV